MMIVRVGGFLGIGEKDIAIPIASFQLVRQGGKASLRLPKGYTKQWFEKAPSFTQQQKQEQGFSDLQPDAVVQIMRATL